MNKILHCLCFYLSFHITACQTFADEVQNTEQPDSASEMVPTFPVKPDRERPSQSAELVEHLKLQQVKTLDPAVFTMIRPYTLDRSPVKLPLEQVLD